MERFARTNEWGAVVRSDRGDAWSILGDDARTALTLEGLDYV